MPKIKNISNILMLLIFINTPYCLALNDYLTNALPQIMLGLQNNTDDLIAQRRTVDITKQALNELATKEEINQDQADQAKKALETIFENNFKQASRYQRAIYNTKRPFQFVYNKITDPNASYLERFAYGAAAAVGVAITGYTAYRGVRHPAVMNLQAQIRSKARDWLDQMQQPTIDQEQVEQERIKQRKEEIRKHKETRSMTEWKNLKNFLIDRRRALAEIEVLQHNIDDVGISMGLNINPETLDMTSPYSGITWEYGRLIDSTGKPLTNKDWDVLDAMEKGKSK